MTTTTTNTDLMTMWRATGGALDGMVREAPAGDDEFSAGGSTVGARCHLGDDGLTAGATSEPPTCLPVFGPLAGTSSAPADWHLGDDGLSAGGMLTIPPSCGLGRSDDGLAARGNLVAPM